MPPVIPSPRRPTATYDSQGRRRPVAAPVPPPAPPHVIHQEAGEQNGVKGTWNRNSNGNRYFVPYATTAPAQPAQAARAAPAAPPVAPDPRDSQFSSGVNRLLFDNTTRRNQITQQGEYEQQDLDTTLARMAQARGQDLLGADHQANKQGLFYSGQLGKQRGNIEQGYGEREFDSRQAFDRSTAARTAALQELGTLIADPNSPLGYSGTGAAGLDLAELFNAAVARRVESNQGVPVASSELAAAESAPAAAAPTAPPVGEKPTVKRGTDSKGNPGEWHTWKNGRKVFVADKKR